MRGAYTTLDLAPATRADGVLPGSPTGPRHDLVDLVVDGRPLLRLLDQADGVDTVSPLASDVPPVLRADHVERLLGRDPGPGDGRRVIYSCPDCEDLGCGVVTAVVEHHGEDVVWRDFAWQTGPTADAARDGYPGVGPYRFHGAAYRSVLLRLLESSACRSVA
ncbi:hypothetical protein [Streptomyces sp. NBC_00572]|uniref:hypothetical protein n=1 Tax=Streptomyces sp. NBC_00572 TaxID=2903664 RepID=UPI002255F334|nr:hypothetical protein [Streptomyces sp. NBC_00572]MCX4984634.1 hypothetical protein [Streptomyces sp. NBC_00572]